MVMWLWPLFVPDSCSQLLVAMVMWLWPFPLDADGATLPFDGVALS